MKRQLAYIVGIVLAVALLAGIFVALSLSTRDNLAADAAAENTSGSNQNETRSPGQQVKDSQFTGPHSPQPPGPNKQLPLGDKDSQDTDSATSTSTSF